MASRALVLGGGGPVGIGWETGMIRGLQEEGVDVTDADVIIGTSAGAAVGTQIASGKTPAELLAEQFVQLDDGAGLTLTPDIPALTEIGQRWIGGSEVTTALRAEIGALAIEAKTPSEGDWLAPFQKGLLSPEWPSRRLVITGVDTATGEFVTWERASGVDLAHAVAASCAVPGIFPPVTIDGRRYMDGGVHSVSNAQLAQGYERIVIIAPSGAGDNPYDNSTRRLLEKEVEALRAAGSSVEYFLPDAGSVEAFGPNRMDATRSRPAAEAGLRQGRAAAAQLRTMWEGAMESSQQHQTKE